MRVDIENFKGEKRYAKYSTFKVGDDASEYRLSVAGYKGNAGMTHIIWLTYTFSIYMNIKPVFYLYHSKTRFERII